MEEVKGSYNIYTAVMLIISTGNQRFLKKYLLFIQIRFYTRISESPYNDNKLYFLDLYNLV